MATVGTIVTRLDLKSDRFVNGLTSAERAMNRSLKRGAADAQQFGGALAGAERGVNGVAAATGKLSSGSKRGRMALLEFSRGFEDFAISASTGGIAAGLRGATNNMNTFLASLGPLGMLATIGVTVGTVLVGYFERTKKATEEAKDTLAEYRKELDRVRDAERQRMDFQVRLRDAGDAAGARGIARRAGDESDVFGAEIAALERQRDALNRQLTGHAMTLEAPLERMGFVDTREDRLRRERQAEARVNAEKQSKELGEQRKLVEEQLAELYDKQRLSAEQRVIAEKQSVELARQEAQAESNRQAIALRQELEWKKQLEEQFRPQVEAQLRRDAERASAGGARGIVEQLAGGMGGWDQHMRRSRAEDQLFELDKMQLDGPIKDALREAIVAAGDGLQQRLGETPTVGVATRGSAAAFSAIQKAARADESKNAIPNQQLQTLKQLHTVLRNIERNTEETVGTAAL